MQGSENVDLIMSKCLKSLQRAWLDAVYRLLCIRVKEGIHKLLIVTFCIPWNQSNKKTKMNLGKINPTF